MKPDLIILFSGGADSALILELALEEGFNPYCVLVDYGQEHLIELEFAQRYLKEKSIPNQIVTLHGLGLRSGLTSGEKSLYDGVHEMYVPQRNLLFVSIAASIAENLDINTIWYGANKTDSLEFPDCTVQWVRSINKFMKENGGYNIYLDAPLIEMKKEEVLEALAYRHIDMNKVFSGYMEDNEDRYVLDLSFIGNKKLPDASAESLGIQVKKCDCETEYCGICSYPWCDHIQCKCSERGMR